MLGISWLVSEVDTNELNKIDITKPLIILVLYGGMLIFLDLPYFAIGIEGFRASFQYIFAFFAAFFLLRNRVHMLTMLYIMVGIGLLMGLHGVYQYIAGVPMPGNWLDAGENVRTRAFSIVGSPNVLGSYMAFSTFLAVGLSLWHLQLSQLLNKTKLFSTFSFDNSDNISPYHTNSSKLDTIGTSKLAKIFSNNKVQLLLCLFFLGAAAVMALCLLLTFSRGALLAFGASMALVAVIISLMYDRRMLFAVVGLAIIGVGAVYVLAPTVVERLVYVFSPEYFEKSSQGGRITRWLNAFDRMRHEPFFGAGLGQYGGAVGARHFGTIYVDNYYAKTWAEMGLVGISLFLWLVGALLKNGYQAWKNVWDSEFRFIAAGLFGGLLAVILHNGVENIFEVPFMNVLFWLTAGILLSLPLQKQLQKQLPEQTQMQADNNQNFNTGREQQLTSTSDKEATSNEE
jgi:O-antigen ligase